MRQEGHLQFTMAANAALSSKPCLKVVGNLTIATDELVMARPVCLTNLNSCAGSGCEIESSPARCSGEGSIFVTQGNLQIRGNAQIVDSYSSDDGGAVHVTGSVEKHSGSLIVTNCSSRQKGGAIYVKESYAQLGGSVSIVDSHSSESGGAVYVKESYVQLGGSVSIVDSYSSDAGGAVYVESMEQHSGSLAFANCSSKGSGGAIYVHKSYQQLGGSVSFTNCSSVDDDYAVEDLKKDDNKYPSGGGGLFVGENLTQKAGLMRFESCSTKFHGGGLFVEKSTSRVLASIAKAFGIGRISFLERSQALQKQPVRLLQSGRAAMHFHNCTAAGRGGGAAVAGRAKIQGGFRVLFDCPWVL